jgi:tetratricopeptide (TPR) repeat protein
VVVASLVLIAGFAAAGVYGFRANQENQRANAYEAAQELWEDEDYEAAMAAFEKLGDYKDSAAMVAKCEKGVAYLEAQDLFDAADYQGAMAAFDALGAFKDAPEKALLCEHSISFDNAMFLFDEGDWASAWSIFSTLADEGFGEAAEWAARAAYRQGEQFVGEGKWYYAYDAFAAAGSFEDAAARAEDCRVTVPVTGEVWHAPEYVSVDSSITLDLTNVVEGYFYKIYAGETPVAEVFVNGGETVTIDVPAGDYTLKGATGEDWWGPIDLFGPLGTYARMTFDDGTDTWSLGSNEILTITVSPSTGDENVSNIDETFDEF